MRLRRPLLLLTALVCAAAALTPAAHAFRLPAELLPLAGNPADRLASLPPDPETYDHAERCHKRSKPGVVRFTAWLQRNAEGVFWGSYRCEKWGKRSASLHAENRAVDWHLDAGDRGDRLAARKLIRLLLAPDKLGTPRALARRMGVEEIIWDCSYWAAGMEQFRPYAPCVNKHGQVRKHVNVTIAHRDHIHFGLSKAGARAKTTFWANAT
jgi:hypothetical protein